MNTQGNFPLNYILPNNIIFFFKINFFFECCSENLSALSHASRVNY